ncbi:hypothetical protein GHT06_012734 [Daphnia sinensis]|uniref:Uncharacterized protein n=1 Tax=Daphnia sinensis TaxID=1820382 RepID=A0AAD5LGF6_9CRUS|nr:hypothetical protein GHT06_012734 [Daphnia sinensis]
MNINRHRRCVLFFWWLFAVVVLVTEGQVDQQFAPKQFYGTEHGINQSDEHSDRTLNLRNDKPRGALRQFSPGIDLVSRMGDEFMIGLEQLKSRISNDYKRYSSSYGGSDYSSSGSYQEGCCDKLDFHTFVPGFVLVAISYFLFFLLNATVTGGRRRRMVTSSKQEKELLLDGPTWLSMVHELWEQDTVLENTICTQETLCRMNRLAMSAPGQAGWAVSLSSLPLSYLLHTRHVGGFTSYMDAAMMGRSGANCTELYSSCPRLSH